MESFNFSRKILFPFGNIAVFGLSGALSRPLSVQEEDFNFDIAPMEGVPTLTSLAFRYKNEIVFLAECIITVNQEKNIVVTPLQGKDGTVKEYISDGDYQITIDAAVSSYDAPGNEDRTAYPMEQIRALVKMLKVKDGLELQSDFLTLFDITSAVVKSYGMVQETHSNRQSFQLQLLSDTPFEIKILEDA